MRFQAFVFLITTSLPVFSQQHNNFQFNPEKYVCHQSDQAITIDGKADELVWQKAPWTEDFIDIEGSIRPKPYYQTRAKMLWDENYFYIYAYLEEPDIWATYDQRDAIIYHENDFEVFIDPDGDTHLYYELEVNALGTIWDLLLVKPYRDGGPAIDGWDIAGLKSAVHVEGTLNDPSDTDSYWSVELAFPWKILEEAAPGGKPPKAGDQWRVNFSRVQYKLDKTETGYTKSINPDTGKPFSEFNWVWSDQGKIAMHQPETWGFVQFSDNSPGEKETFVWNPEEDIKWKLRKLYYYQKDFYREHRMYNEDINEEGFEIEITKSGYVISHETDSGTWHISNDGKVWKTTR